MPLPLLLLAAAREGFEIACLALFMAGIFALSLLGAP